MIQPKLTVLPGRPAVRSDVPTTLDVLLTIDPPMPENLGSRPPLNLGFVIDRSGSMGERNKITFAREAVEFAVRELRPSDHVSITIFDERIETVFAHAPATDKDAIIKVLQQVQPRGSTNLFGGWQEGGNQVKTHRQTEGLNRVLLLSDGLANVGESRPDVIATAVLKMAQDGVSTSTLGVGDDYNEDLLEAMAQSGDGNYYYVESPAQLPHIFRTELQGLTATLGVNVCLTLDTKPGVVVAEVLNEFDKTLDGRLKLPNLVGGQPLRVLVRLNVDAYEGQRDLIAFGVDWHSPKDDTRQTATSSLTLPAVPSTVWDGLAENSAVVEQAVLLLSARRKKAAALAAERGDYLETQQLLNANFSILRQAIPSPEILRELEDQAAVEQDFKSQEMEKFSKRAKNQSYRRHTSKPQDEPN